MNYTTIYHSPIGPLSLTGDGTYLTGLRPGDPGPNRDPCPVFSQTAAWLDQYFAGMAPDPRELPLAPAGTPFQRQVWDRLLLIPWGQTRTYGDIAREMGNPRACQAVGQAVGRNPIGIIIPCHRVVGSGGKLTGFAWGLDKKKWLLSHEAAGGSP